MEHGCDFVRADVSVAVELRRADVRAAPSPAKRRTSDGIAAPLSVPSSADASANNDSVVAIPAAKGCAAATSLDVRVVPAGQGVVLNEAAARKEVRSAPSAAGPVHPADAGSRCRSWRR
jgi:hypothetical protein